MAVQAATGPEALALVKEQKPAIALINVTLPGRDGYNVCKAIRANYGSKAPPVILISDREGMLDRAKWRMAGAKDFVTQPFTAEELESVVLRHTGGK